MEERLQKILAQAGMGSRRACEALIIEGRVMVDGKIALIGSKADLQKNRILVDGKPVQAEPLAYIALHKPRGVLSAVSDPHGRPTVRDMVDLPGTLYPVGRLDYDSEGLILLTNDGELAEKITHPRYGCEKEYRVLVPRAPDQDQLAAWQHGVVLEDGQRTAPARVWVESETDRGTWLRVVMHEGKKRQIREVGARIGLPVSRLMRVRIASLQLGSLKPREWRTLTSAEISALKNSSTPAKTGLGRKFAQPRQGFPGRIKKSR